MYVVINTGQKELWYTNFAHESRGRKAKKEKKKTTRALRAHTPRTLHALAVHIASALSCNLDICCRRPLPSRARPVMSRKHMHMDSAVHGHGRWAWL